MASGNEPVCKVCYNELDVTDRSFQACECGFQVSPAGGGRKGRCGESARPPPETRAL